MKNHEKAGDEAQGQVSVIPPSEELGNSSTVERLTISHKAQVPSLEPQRDRV